VGKNDVKYVLVVDEFVEEVVVEDGSRDVVEPVDV